LNKKSTTTPMRTTAVDGQSARLAETLRGTQQIDVTIVTLAAR
jgi:hypothetical protein